MAQGQERTEPATQKRRERARAEGEHARSVLAPCALAIAFSALPILCGSRFAKWWVAAFDSATHLAASAAQDDARLSDALGILSSSGAWLPVGFAFGAAVASAIVAAAVCDSIRWAPGSLRWRFSQLALGSGLRQLVSAETISHTVLSLAAAICVAGAASDVVADLVMHDDASWQATTLRAWRDLSDLWSRNVIALSVVAAIDVTLARRRFAARLRMTPREVRDERAEQEGRPEIKSRRRGIALRRSRRLRIEALKRASAVVTNPTHVAVALRYAPPAIEVPVVVAAGAGAFAAIVRSIAAYNDVPIIESPELARALFARVDVDEPVPEEMYAAVAAIFAWILRTRGRLGGAVEA